MRALAILCALGLAACQSDEAYFAHQRQVQAAAAAMDLDTDTIMDGVCRAKLQHPETLTAEWRRYCEQRGFRLT